MKKYLIVLIGVCMLIFASCTKQVYNKTVSKNAINIFNYHKFYLILPI